ncbi:MAG TPA: site-specific DNA-methyltransferase [Acidimicrobiales bacterium]
MSPRGALPKRGTATSNFGVGRRENHDSSAFYARFRPPVLSNDDRVQPPTAVDMLFCGDARDMGGVADASVALVVTSPPYFAGKTYEEALGQDGIPGTYVEYLDLLTEVFAECARTLEPGGRIAVNVANLGRKPFRSLASDVITILQDRLGLLLRGEIVWQKGRGAGGSCAWGSYRSPANPSLRDLTERVVIAGKGRFDRAQSRAQRARRGLPCEPTVTADEFLEATLDVWELPPESATRVDHPAPFPVELPQRLIELYTYAGDLVLDPFLGSGSTAVAAVRTGRHYTGYDVDPAYVEAARARVRAERERIVNEPVPLVVQGASSADELSRHLLEGAGCTEIRNQGGLPKVGAGTTFSAIDARGRPVAVDVVGGLVTGPAGLKRADAVWRVIAKAALLRDSETRYVVLTTGLPSRSSPLAGALRGAEGLLAGVVDITTPGAAAHLQSVLDR